MNASQDEPIPHVVPLIKWTDHVDMSKPFRMLHEDVAHAARRHDMVAYIDDRQAPDYLVLKTTLAFDELVIAISNDRDALVFIADVYGIPLVDDPLAGPSPSGGTDPTTLSEDYGDYLLDVTFGPTLEDFE